ncbi:hypothetical protein, partial [Deinococcus sp. 23YEL01]|uniref:hypothetical protein n=1 Tax=Deinococcus sp. 23YEL01 TaxID=2745871 RepID=UPI001E2901E7
MPFPFSRDLTFRVAVTAALLLAPQAGAQQATPLEQLTAPLQPNLQVVGVDGVAAQLPTVLRG